MGSPAIRNVLLILTDQHSREGIGCYGNPWMRTPRLDALAAEGSRFENCYCPAPLCVPSRMSFLTAKTPSKNRVWDNFHMLEHTGRTWIDGLNAAGVRTDLVGRMHFVGKNQIGAFQGRPLGEFTARPQMKAEDHPNYFKKFSGMTTGQCREAVEVSGSGETLYQWFDARVTDATCDYLRERSEVDEPFFAVSGMVLPHCPFIAPKELFDYYYAHAPEVGPGEDLPLTVQRFLKARGIKDPPVSAERKRIARAAYFALCEMVDRNVGQILDCLEATGLREDTLVIYASDHGEMAGQKECWWKSTFYEDSAGVPMIVSGPPGWKTAEQVPSICNLLDIGPTVAELMGAALPEPVDGRSLVRLLNGDASSWEEETFSEFVDMKPEYHWAGRMIRSGPWKLWEFHDEDGLPPSLFNLDEDPEETTDLWGRPDLLEVGEALRKRLHADWDPEFCLAEAKRKREATYAMMEWAEKTQPETPYYLSPPEEEVDRDLNFYEERTPS